MAIFSLLFSFWSEFCQFRSAVSDEKTLPVLSRRRDKKLDRLKRKMKGEDSQLLLTRDDPDDLLHLRKNMYEMYDIARRRGTLSDTYLESGSVFSAGTYGPKPVTWSYSKYIEALEQEKMLLKIQEELARKRMSSLSVTSSMPTTKTDATRHSVIRSAISMHQPPKR